MMWINLIPKSFFPSTKNGHVKLYPAFDPNKDSSIMLDIKGIRYYEGLFLAVEISVHLPNLTTTRRLMVASSFINEVYQDFLKCYVCHMLS